MADNLVMEERDELMVSPTGGHVCPRRAHFLKPSITSINDPIAAPSLSSSSAPLAEYNDLPLTVRYQGWKSPPEDWKTWVDQMHSLHHSTWKRSGILDAIMASKCTIHRYDDLILGFVEKWCPTTNSFVFPWGEATITLEDMMVLGGYSVLGESVLIPSGNEEIEEVVKKLHKARSNISKGKAKKATQGRWITQFMSSGSEIEHEAFLAYWLSRFVFPFTRDTIGRSVVSIAVHLARGTKIAVAPSVLATIYKSLTLLKAAVVAARKYGTKLEITVTTPLALVQVWIWERFPLLRPKPKSIGRNGPRMARWDSLKLGSEYRSLTVDSVGKDFQWRPYSTTECNVFPGLVYMNNERWVMVDSDLDEDLNGFVRCLRTSELVSLEENCIEHYLPHRVAMQFGMDQDLPGDVARVNVNREIAWRDYTRPIRDAKLYVPPRVSKPCVTARYLKWWKKLNLGWRGMATCEDSKVEVKKEIYGRKSEDDFLSPPPGFSPKRKGVEGAETSGIAEQLQDVHSQSPLYSADSNGDFGGKGSSKSSKRPRKLVESSSEERSDCKDSVHPPGFPPKYSQVKASSHSGNGIQKEEVPQQSQDDAQGENHLSSETNNGNIQEEMLLVESVESDQIKCTTTKEACIELEERIRNIEKLYAGLKAGKLVCLR